MGSWTEDIVRGLERIGGSGHYDAIYESVRLVRTEPLPASWKEIIRREIQQHSSDSAAFTGASDLFFSLEGLGRGVWGLRSAASATPAAADLSSGDDSPERAQQSTYRILRDTKLARQLKVLHRNQCQLCGLALPAGDGVTYAEAHHIIPLGGDHHGGDVAENILVLCPNHHAQCDLGAIALDQRTIRSIPGHAISPTSIRYHNERIAAGAPVLD